MASGQTTNFGLNQWAAEDQVLREEFNQDNVKIEAALGLLPKIITGSYVGTGTKDAVHCNTGARPKLVIISTSNTQDSGAWVIYAIAWETSSLVIYNNTVRAQMSPNTAITFQEDGFTVNNGFWDKNSGFNVLEKTISYWAWC